MDNMNMENANDHPFKVSVVKDAEMFANSHPFKVKIEGGGGGGEGRVVDELPEEGETGYIYLVLKEHTSEGDVYDEWIWALQQDGETYGWEHLGATNEVKVGGTTILTSADYNWNSTSHSAVEPYDSVALWLLEPGMYIFSSGTNGYVGYRNHTWYSTSVNKLYQVNPQGTYSKMIIAWEEYHIAYGSPMDIGTAYGVLASSGGSIVHSCSISAPISDISAPQTASATGTALAASVGYNLNQKIGDLTTLTTTAKTSTVAAINELVTTIGNIQTILNIVNNGSES